MRVLGISDGQTSGAAVLEDGHILAAVNEERITRLKMARGFPWQAIQEVLELTGTSAQDLVGVAVAQVEMELREEVTGWPGWFEARAEDRDLHSVFFQLAARWGKLADHLPLLKRGYYLLRTPAYVHRRRRIGQILANTFGITAPLRFVHHHLAHAAAAYYTSGFDDALVVTMDGGGDRHCSHVYEARAGRLRRLNTVDSFDSLGNYYAYVTALCGFKAKRHEGKITGLAARGEPIFADMLRSMIDCEGGRLVNRAGVLFQTALEEIASHLPKEWRRRDLAASIQLVAEQVTCRYVAYWARHSGLRRVAVAGGLFANVRINEEVHNLPEIEEIFVHPGMTDEGLAVGAALALETELREQDGRHYDPRHLPDVYLGRGYSRQEIDSALEGSGLRIEHLPGAIEERIAEKLSQGKVVARFAGRMEYGPRALGNRSILYQPGDPSVNDWLNELLRRTEFMPFAPSSLAEASHDLYESCDGGLDSARFMTITFHCTPWMRERCGGVVHVDGTARPQVVRAEDSPSYHRIISAYRHLTGVPVIINTSFNIHEEPIVRSPQDALRAFLDSKLDYLALGDAFIEGPVGSEETRRSWEGRSRWGRPRHAATAR